MKHFIALLITMSCVCACVRPPPRAATTEREPPAQVRPAPRVDVIAPAGAARKNDASSSWPALSLSIAKATTTAAGSVPATCLLDPACDGTWAPAAVDSGTDESVLFMFEGPVWCGAVEVELAERVTSPREGHPPIEMLNERGAESHDVVTHDGGLTWIGRCYRHNNVRIAMTGSAPVEIRAVRFLDDDGKRIRVHVPRLVKATVSASSSLSPIAHQPAFLFDSRRTFAWAYDGANATNATAATVTVTFDAPLTLTGLRVSNGNQRSSAHLAAHARPTSLRVRAGDQERRVALDARVRDETVTFASLTRATRVDLIVDEFQRGTNETAQHVAISELRFIDGDGRIVHPVVAATIPRANEVLVPIVDVSYVGVVGDVVTARGGPFACVDRRLRISSTSAFAAVTAIGPRTLEGGWEPRSATSLRAFGVWHSAGAPAGGTDEMFDAEVRVQAFDALDDAERARVAAAVWRQLADGVVEGVVEGVARTRDGVEIARSPADLERALTVLPGAMAVQTPLFTDVMLPADDVPFFCE